jgi:putative ABC transport system substrate-binding protein
MTHNGLGPLSDLRRREFITLVGGVAAAWCSVAGAQTPRERPIIGTFGSGTPTQRKGLPTWPLFLKGLRELGYIEGRDYDIIARLAASTDELQKVAERLVQLNPDVILASASANALAAKRATSTIPIVVAALGNPAALGLSENDFRRPSGNLTGPARETLESLTTRAISRRQGNGMKSMMPPQNLRSSS